MSEIPVLNGGRPWWLIGHRGYGGNPFASLGMDYCPTCHDEVKTRTETYHRKGVYTYRRWCRGCGLVLKYGAALAELVGTRPVPRAALDWVTRPGEKKGRVSWMPMATLE